jgi:hypothetical protein
MNQSERKVERHFGEFAWVKGKGPFAVLFPCGDLTVMLFPTLELAEAHLAEENRHPCGGQCNPDDEERKRQHFIVDLRTTPHGWMKRLVVRLRRIDRRFW